MIKQYISLIENTDWSLSIFSNTAAFIMEYILDLNWAGFYFLKENTLYLGPFVGKIACTTIPIHQGVCGACIRQQKPILVNDVHQFPGHIACDSASQSELVIPLYLHNTLIGLLDIDSPKLNRFSEDDLHFFIELVNHLQHELEKAPLSFNFNQ